MLGRFPEPASGPTVLGLADRLAQVVWWVRNTGEPFDPSEDWMWQTYVSGATFRPPQWLWGEPGAQQPRLAAGPDGSLHAVFRSWNPTPAAYNTNYIQRLPSDPGAWPPNAYGPPPLFPAELESADMNLAVARNPVGGETRAHIVWSQAVDGLPLPLIYYSRAGVGWQRGITEGASLIRGPGCSLGGVGINCYAGYAPAVAVVQRDAAREVVVVWEGRNYFNNADTIYFGYTHLQADGATDPEWSTPAQLSGLAENKGSAACSVLRAEKPSVALSPTGQLHAVWLEQAADCNYYVRTARLRYDPGLQTYLPDYLEQVSPRPVAIQNQTAVDRPRLAFDAQGRRYVVWKESYTEIRATVGDPMLDQWQDLGKLNTGVCGDSQVVEAVDLSASPSRTMLHAVWVGGVTLSNAHVCYSSLDTLVNRGYLPLLEVKAARP